MVIEFVIGKKYTNDQICFALNVENLGGVRPSVDARKNLQHLAIFTTAQTYEKNISENPYHDRIEKDVLIYTAQGRTGDQTITGRNKRIIEQYSNPIPFYCFSNEGRQVYTFLGLLELLRHYQEYQIDKKNILRTVWIFEFRIHSEIPVVPLEKAKELTSTFFEESRRINVEEREVVPLKLPGSEGQEPPNYETEELRIQLLQINPYRFEHLVRDVIEAHGFKNVSVTSASQDGGIDVNAYVSDSDYFFSKTHVQFQVKRWRHSVGSVEINSFRGALNTTAKSVFVTTSHFTKAAIREAEHPVKPSISLIDGFLFSKIIRQVSVDLNSYK
ncbi:MAG: restriction system protein [Blastocatellia bacterium]|nr:restriction system protein [Blastocatellia bacterium]